MLWVLLWVGLALAAGLVLALVGRLLWQKLKAVTREVGAASERVTAALATLNDLTEPAVGQQTPRTATHAGTRRDGRDRRGHPH